MVQCFWVNTYVRRRPVFYSLDAGFFFIGIFVPILNITAIRIKANAKSVPILTKMSRDVKVFI